MAKEFTRISLYRADYRWLHNKFSNDEPRPVKGVLIKRAHDHIDELEKEIAEINKVLQENVK